MSNRGFNLLRQQLTPPTAWDKIYQWMVGTARVVIIFVEIIVVLAFAARVVVDTISKNLDKTIERRNAELTAFRSTELDYLTIQDKTLTYSDLWAQSSNVTDKYIYVNNLVRNINGDISVAINKDEVSITGEIALADLKLIEEKMKNDTVGSNESAPIFSSVELLDVDSQGDLDGDKANFSVIGKFIQQEFNRELETF